VLLLFLILPYSVEKCRFLSEEENTWPAYAERKTPKTMTTSSDGMTQKAN
jgi:hypothetical protein